MFKVVMSGIWSNAELRDCASLAFETIRVCAGIERAGTQFVLTPSVLLVVVITSFLSGLVATRFRLAQSFGGRWSMLVFWGDWFLRVPVDKSSLEKYFSLCPN